MSGISRKFIEELKDDWDNRIYIKYFAKSSFNGKIIYYKVYQDKKSWWYKQDVVSKEEYLNSDQEKARRVNERFGKNKLN